MGGFCEGVGRMFTPSDSDGSGNVAVGSGGGKGAPDIGNIGDVGSLESQAAQRRLARMSKYFTSPTGVLGENTGSSGVF
jgi:hypothetical protein